jgi:ATP-dependent Clp protease ATP-binding subunit ClpC
MADRSFLLRAILCTLDDGSCLGRLLLFPEVSAYDRDCAAVVEEVHRLAGKVLGGLPLAELHRRRQLAGDIEHREVTLDIPPPATRTWSEPLRVRFDVICWNHGREAGIGYVPALDLEIIASDPEELDGLIPDEIHFALLRDQVSASLQSLAHLQRVESVRLETLVHQADIKTPKQLAQQREPEQQESVLDQVGSRLSGFWLPPVFGLDTVVQSLGEWLYGRTPRSVLLIGPSGVGKTAAVHKLAASQKPRPAAQPPIWSTSGSRLVAGMTGFGMWQQRCQQMCDEAAKAKAVVHLGNLMELLQVGQSVGNDMGIGEFLRPTIARGGLLAIAECTVEELGRIEQISPAMLDAFVRLEVPEPSEDESLAILHEAAKIASLGAARTADLSAIVATDRLHRRYATYSACPGRPLRFLKNLIADAWGPGLSDESSSSALTAVDVTTAFSRETGLPEWLLQQTIPLDLTATRNWFQQRVIGQSEAVDVVVDLLATVKAELARPSKPLASLLLIGPTGVGKTEMAKSLAEFLYQDRQRMIRIDMSEYADAVSIERLIGTSYQAEGLLTAKVREQPFAVVLLDEFEKAHPRFFDLLLQVLGEGRLTDAAGRLADFRNAVVIMTSNLGAESFGRPTLGFQEPWAADQGAREHFVHHVREFVRPELFNRIDRIVTFLPLAEEVLRAIADRELGLLRQRDGICFRDLQIEFGPTLAETLVRQNCDPRYGARPLKRAVERQVLAPLSAALNEQSSRTPLRAKVTTGSHGVRVKLHSRRSKKGRAGTSEHGQPEHEAAQHEAAQHEPVELEPTGQEPATARAMIEPSVELRRSATALARCAGVMELRNEWFMLQRAEQRLADQRARGGTARPGKPDEDRWTADRLELVRSLIGQVDGLADEAAALEEHLLTGFYLGRPSWDISRADDAKRLAASLDDLARRLYAAQFRQSDSITMVIYCRQLRWLYLLSRAYYELASSQRYAVDVYALQTRSDSQDLPPNAFLLGDCDSADPQRRAQANETRLLVVPLADLGRDLEKEANEAIGVALGIRGPQARLLLESEDGLHVFQDRREKTGCLVHCSDQDILRYRPPHRVDRRDGIGNQPVRRVCDAARKRLTDRVLGSQMHWPGEFSEGLLTQLVQAVLESRIKEWMRS